MYNAWCIKCRRMVQVPTEDKPKCPQCGSKVDIKGKVVKIITSNGPYAPHL
jgi:DNA-directed RNA polymerase subunit RPC12/RpoP